MEWTLLSEKREKEKRMLTVLKTERVWDSRWSVGFSVEQLLERGLQTSLQTSIQKLLLFFWNIETISCQINRWSLAIPMVVTLSRELDLLNSISALWSTTSSGYRGSSGTQWYHWYVEISGLSCFGYWWWSSENCHCDHYIWRQEFM